MLNLRRSDDVERNPTGLNNEFEYQGKKHHINLSFDTVLSFYKLLDDGHFTDAEKVEITFELFFGYMPKDADFAVEAFQQIGKYLSLDPYGHAEEEENASQSEELNPKWYSFEQDAEAIYASFWEQYGIDLLQEKGKLHWDQFKALFAGLGPDTYFMRIVRIRQEDVTELDGQAQADLIEAQQHYALNDTASQDTVQKQVAQKMDDLGHMLMSLAKS